MNRESHLQSNDLDVFRLEQSKRNEVFNSIINESFGCFVYLLEDEKKEVRIKALDVLMKLNKQCQNIDREIKDLLYDMLNDEND